MHVTDIQPAIVPAFMLCNAKQHVCMCMHALVPTAALLLPPVVHMSIVCANHTACLPVLRFLCIN